MADHHGGFSQSERSLKKSCSFRCNTFLRDYENSWNIPDDKARRHDTRTRERKNWNCPGVWVDLRVRLAPTYFYARCVLRD